MQAEARNSAEVRPSKAELKLKPIGYRPKQGQYKSYDLFQREGRLQEVLQRPRGGRARGGGGGIHQFSGTLLKEPVLLFAVSPRS